MRPVRWLLFCLGLGVILSGGWVSPRAPAAAGALLINEIDVVTADEAAEFVELYDGGVGHTSLDGLTLVLYRGDYATVYLAVSLNGYQTDDQGYFIAGGQALAPDLAFAADQFRDGPDAVALYAAPRSQFPFGSPVVVEGLLDAVVYAPDAQPTPGLEALLLPGEAPVDEGQRGAAADHSAQRFPNGAGRPLETSAFAIAPPTPRAPNQRIADTPPAVVSFSPTDGASDVATTARVEVTFSEPVALAAEALEIACDHSGVHTYITQGGSLSFRFLPKTPLAPGERCELTLFKDRVADLDEDDPPDGLLASLRWSFTTAPFLAENVLINEIDADTPGSDTAEFIELYDGGVGHTALDGLLVVLFNGSDDLSYHTVALDGYATDAAGYFLLANAAVIGADLVLANGALQNGTDAAVLVAGRADDFPNGTAVTAIAPRDAIVYGPGGQPDAGLLPLLNNGQAGVDENGRGQAESHSNQRCPNGAGGARNTAGYRQNTPTPGAASDCVTDSAPIVTDRVPAPGATGIAIGAPLTITFSEPVSVAKGWLTLTCATSGAHAYSTTGGPTAFVVQPGEAFAHGETCTATLKAQSIKDVDTDDPPDTLTGDSTWTFTTAAAPPDFLLINEIDPDTPGSDTAEFIELFDGGRGGTKLDGLVLVFYNGATNTSYRALDLDGQRSDASGYWLAGNAATAPGLVFADSGLQNGPDAVALYAGDAAQFPNDTPVRTAGLLDAIVYGDAPGLLPLLLAGEGGVNEGARGAAEQHALQRCPNGAGGQRRTAAFRPNPPTPGALSRCTVDAAPVVSNVLPAAGANAVAVATTLTVTFSEPVTPDAGWLRLRCGGNDYALTIAPSGSSGYTATPTAALPHAATCQATVKAASVHDADADDPPDAMTADFVWSFTTAAPPAGFVLINELDSDTPGNDTAEFVELYDGGAGATALDGLVLVFFNGQDDHVYYVVDLDGVRTGAAGYAVAGSAALGGAVTLPAAVLQNGPDAVALYEGDASDFPVGASLTTAGLLDAAVYGTADPVDAGLLSLLAAGEPQIDEAARGAAETDSSGRCPNGAGGQRRTAVYRQNAPTPGAINDCHVDAPPSVVTVSPPYGTTGVATTVTLSVTFSEPVAPDAGWLHLRCANNDYAITIAPAGASGFTATPTIALPHAATCQATIAAVLVHDADGDDPPDAMASDFVWSFTTAAPVADFVLINELDSDTPGNDTAEFIELYDGGAGGTALDGLVLVFFNGQDDRAYVAVDLDGARTDATGYAIAGGASLHGAVTLPNAVLQNGPDAVALYEGDAADFPVGAAITTAGLRDAAVYGTADPGDAGLLPLLAAGEPQIDEAARGAAETDSSGRCPNGAGGPRRTSTYRQNPPTPGAANDCHLDAPPAVLSTTPGAGATQVAVAASLEVKFSEPVTPAAGWLRLRCDNDDYAITVAPSGSSGYTATPTTALPYAATCQATISAALVHDADADDPPDTMAVDFTWTFTVVSAPAADFVLINELDSDTPGNDTAEFVELYDGGAGQTSLAGLVLVFYNGKDDRVYYAADLNGARTDTHGYAVVGSAALGGAVTLPAAALQNGPDAVALYAGSAAGFPIGSPVTTVDLLDAVVYGTGDATDAGLLPLLATGQAQIDEAARGAAETDASGRCPNGAGEQRYTSTYRQNPPTPGAANDCRVDAPPAVVAFSPTDGATGVATDAIVSVTFSEPVTPADGWLRLRCGDTDYTVTVAPSGASGYTATPTIPLPQAAACRTTIAASLVHDADSDDPPDSLTSDVVWSFTVASAPVADSILINEIDSDTPGDDSAEFIELYDGGRGHVDLSGLVVVLWNGREDTAYAAFDLDDRQTDGDGYFVLGSAALADVDLSLPDATLQNGPDAVALYAAPASAFPDGAPLTTVALRDAIVYGPTATPDAGLLALLVEGQPQVDEAGRGDAAGHALARCPDGQGGPRHTDSHRPAAATPGRANACALDQAPAVVAVWPPPDAGVVSLTARLTITFSEAVRLEGAWFVLECAGRPQAVTTLPGPGQATVVPAAPLPAGARCAAAVLAAGVADEDGDDPPDRPAADYRWGFDTAIAPPPLVAVFGSNSPAWIDAPVVFLNSSTGPGALAYTWDFGDGHGSTLAQPRHRYAAPGRYTVSLTATTTSDPPRSATATATVEVRPRLAFAPLVVGRGE